MNVPTMLPARTVAPDTTLLGAYVPLPGLGVVPVNSYLLAAREPVLVDTGLLGLGDQLLEQLQAIIDPEDIGWIYLTHTDPDHAGNLTRLLELASNATVVTTFLGLGKLGLSGIQPERAHLLNPGQKLHVGDRELMALRPPVYDAPETTALFDTASSTLFSSDCFGGVFPEPFESTRAVPPETLAEGVIGWTTIDSPWLHGCQPDALESAMRAIVELDPGTILGSHLPPAEGGTQVLLEHVRRARTATPFVGPDQAALEKMMAS